MGVTTTGGIVLRVSALIRLRTIGRHWWHADKASSNPTFLCILHKGEDKWSKNKDKMQNDMINKRAYRQAKRKNIHEAIQKNHPEDTFTQRSTLNKTINPEVKA